MRKLLKLSLVLAAGGTLLAQDAGNANSVKKRVLILGDSITAGYGLDPEEAYPAILQRKIDAAALPYTVKNAGVSGDTTSGGLRRIEWALGSEGADVLVVALGGNDGLRGIAPAEISKNLAGIIDKARAKNPQIKVLVAGMQMPENFGATFTSEFRAVFPEVAGKKRTALVDHLLEGVGGDEKLNQPDRIHPTAEGQQIIAENVWKVLEGQLVK
jgi:acyl-CoA thioesterase I